MKNFSKQFLIITSLLACFFTYIPGKVLGATNENIINISPANTNAVNVTNYTDAYSSAVFTTTALASTQLTASTTIDKICVTNTTAQSASNLVITLFKNDIATAAAVTLPSGSAANQIFCSAAGQNVTFNGTSDLLSIRRVQGATGTSASFIVILKTITDITSNISNNNINGYDETHNFFIEIFLTIFTFLGICFVMIFLIKKFNER